MRSFTLILALILSQGLFAQNVGINNTSPNYPLDVIGDINLPLDDTLRFGGVSAMHMTSSNTSVGLHAGINISNLLFSNGAQNVLVGTSAGRNLSSGDRNLMLGYQAGYQVNTGVANLLLGYRAGYNFRNGTGAIFIGHQAGYTNSTGTMNIMIGYDAGFGATNSDSSIFIGYRSGYSASSTAAVRNTFIGYQAGENEINGADNIVLGYRAALNMSGGLRNIVMGTRAGQNMVLGDQNSLIGYEAGMNLSTSGANNNVMIGFRSGNAATDGSNNTFLGSFAGSLHTTGDRNTYIGSNTRGMLNTFTNATALGYSATAPASNSVTLGNTSMTQIGGYDPWTNLSDGRFKVNVQENVPGLDLILALRPVSYKMDMQGLNAFIYGDQPALQAEMDSLSIPKAQKQYTGFIAQEVEAAAQALGYDFSGVHKPQGEHDHYGLSYSTFVVPTVKAIQEQQQQIEDLRAENALLKQRLEAIEAMLVSTQN